MASIAKLVVTLGANTAAFETDIKRAGRISAAQMRKMERDAKRLNDQWNRNFKMAGVAVAGAMVLATKAAIDFESAMAEVATLGSGDMDMLADSVKRLSVEFGQAPVDQAKALYQIISAGAETAADQIEILTVANKLAVGGLTDVATAADGLTTTLNAYSLEASDAQRVSDIFFNTMKQGKTTIPEINAAIGNVATIASQAGVSLEELGAATALVTKQGQDTSKSMDGLRGVLSAVLKQSEQTKKAAKDIGIEFDLARLKSVGLSGVLQDIADSGATADQLSKLVGRVEGLTNALSLVKDGGRAFAQELLLIKSGIGATDDAVAVITKSTKFLMQQLSSAVSVAAINFGEKLIPAVQSAARIMITNFNAVISAIESLVAVLVTRLAVAGVAALVAATAATNGLAVAMAIVGGPIGALAIGVALLVTNFENLARMDNPIGTFFRYVAFAAQLAATAIAAVTLELANFAQLLLNFVTTIATPAATALGVLVNALNQVANGDFSGAFETLNAAGSEIANNFDLAAGRIKDNVNKIGLSIDVMKSGFADAKDTFSSWGESISDASSEAATLAPAMDEASKAIKKTGAAADDAAKLTDKLSYQMKLLEARSKAANALMEDSVDYVEELEEAQRNYEESLQALINAADPVSAAMDTLNNEVDLLAQGYADGKISLEQYADALEYVAGKYGAVVQGSRKAKESVDMLSVAIDEGARILERSFTQMWENMLSGYEDTFAGVMDGFKTMLAQMVHQASTQKIILNVQQGMKGGFTQGNMAEIGAGIAQYAAVIIGSKLGGGGTGAQTGAAIGMVVGSIVGSFIPVIGTMIGGIIGSILGGFVGGMFEKRPEQFRAAGDQRFVGLSKSDQETMIETALGKTYITTRRADEELIAEISKGLDEFDSALAGFLDADQIGKITESLTDWNIHMTGEAISMEDLLNSRFANIMTTFSQTIQDFVADGKDLEDQFARLQIGVAAGNIMDEVPDLFGGRSVADFLKVVEAFKTGSMTITEAFQTVLTLLDQVGTVMESLRQFADSSLGDDFAALVTNANMSLSEAVAGMQSGLMDAIAAFDGSPEQLNQIGQMAMIVREGELKLLAEIDAIQQGISANLAQLKADLLGLTAEDKTGEQLFNEAGSLVAMLASAQTPQEVADLAQRFEALIRQMSPEDQARNQSELLRMIADFDAGQKLALEGMKQTAIDNAQAIRDLVDVFLLDIGPPLDIVANTNETAAAALSEIAEVDLEGHLVEQETILQDGVDGIAGEISTIGPVVADALRQALNGYNVTVAVNVEQPGLVTQ